MVANKPFVNIYNRSFFFFFYNDNTTSSLLNTNGTLLQTKDNLLLQLQQTQKMIKQTKSTCLLLIILSFFSDDVEKFTSEMHDPCARCRCLRERTTQKHLQKAPVWSRPNTLRKLSQKCFYNSRVLERS